MISVIVVPADLDNPVHREKIGPCDVDAIRTFVGGPIELVKLDNPEAGIYLNDEGKLEGLAFNYRATVLAWLYNDAMRGNDYLAGDVVLVGPADRHGNDMSVPEELDALIFKTKRCRVEGKDKNAEQWTAQAEVYVDPFAAMAEAISFLMRGNAEDVRVVAADG